jgi:glycosyltransferase involved in cell wall biosynthesis
VLRRIINSLIAKALEIQPGIALCAPQYEPKPLSTDVSEVKHVPLSSHPNVSIVIPSYNQGLFLERTIKSLISQGYPQLEILVSDGGSEDGSREIIERYSNHFKWWCSESDRGQTHALNKGFRRSTGEIMGWLNSDDQLAPGALYRVIGFFSEHSDVDAVYGHRILIDENDMEVGRWTLPPHDSRVLTWADYVPQETLFWRRRLWNRVGAKLDERFQFAMDWDLLLRLRDAGAKMVRLPHFLGLFRVHAGQKTCANIESTGFHEMQLLRKRCLGYAPTQGRIARGVVWYLAKAWCIERMWRRGFLNYG